MHHEMIRHLQTERLGIIKTWNDPEWFIEGIAYSLSEDPRAKLSEPFGKYSSQFKGCYAGVGKERVTVQRKVGSNPT
jgi:hypothetical protein